MSLRSKIEAKKTAKKEEKEAVLQIEQQEQHSTLSQQLDTLLQKREALKKLKDEIKETRQGVTESSAKVKAERKNLHDLRELSKDEETNTYELPEIRELASSDEFAEEEEIKSYNSAKSKVKTSVAGAKELKDRIRETLGIEGPISLVPKKLDALISDSEESLNQETRSFLLEHPDVDPERTAEVREEIISQRQKQIESHLTRWTSSKLRTSFGNNLPTDERGRESLEYAVANAVDAFRNSDRDTSERSMYMASLKNVFGSDADSITEFDTEALARALTRQMVTNENGKQPDKKTSEGILEIVRRTYGRKNSALPKEFFFEGEDAHEIDNQKLAAFAIQNLQRNKTIESLAEELLEKYKKVVTVEGTPSRVAEMRKEIGSITDKIESRFVSRDHSESLGQRILDAASSERDITSKISEIQTQIDRIKRIPNLLLHNQIPDELKDLEVGIKLDERTREYYVDPNGSRLDKVLTKLHSDTNDISQELLVAKAQKTRIQQESDGFLGMKKGDKQNRLQEVEQTIARLTDAVATNAAEIQEKEGSLKFVRRSLTEKFKDVLPLVRSTQVTLNGLVTELQGMPESQLPNLEQRLAELQAQETEIQSTKASLEQEKQDLLEQQRALRDSIPALEKEGERLKRELQAQGYVAKGY